MNTSLVKYKIIFIKKNKKLFIATIKTILPSQSNFFIKHEFKLILSIYPDKIENMTLVLILYATWSSVFAFGKAALENTTPLFMTGSRMLLSGSLMILFLLFTKKKQLYLDKKQWISVIILSLLSIYLTNILEFWGLQYLSAAKTCFIYSLSPFFSALFSYIHFKEKMSLAKWFGMIIGILGMIPVFMNQTGSEDFFNAFAFFTWPTLAVIGAALFSVYGWVILRLILKNSKISVVSVNGSSMAIGGILALLTSFFFDGWSPGPPIKSGFLSSFSISLVGMTLLYNIFCYNLYGYLLKRYTATFLSFMGLLSPIFASLSAWVFLNEPLSWQIFLSTSFVSIGLFIIYRAELKQGYILDKKAPSEKEALT